VSVAENHRTDPIGRCMDRMKTFEGSGLLMVETSLLELWVLLSNLCHQ